MALLCHLPRAAGCKLRDAFVQPRAQMDVDFELRLKIRNQRRQQAIKQKKKKQRTTAKWEKKARKKKERHGLKLPLPIFPRMGTPHQNKITTHQKKNPCRQFHTHPPTHVTEKGAGRGFDFWCGSVGG